MNNEWPLVPFLLLRVASFNVMSISHTLDLEPHILIGLQRALTCNAARF